MSIQHSKLRIIAGKFRGRKISFSNNNPTLRPTLNRVRETLFNWLSPYIVGANCLDLFAGSGVFSFEALSRGAKFALSIEKSYATYQDIIKNKQLLKLSDQELLVSNQDVLACLHHPAVNMQFDIVFLDPPYLVDQQLLLTSLNLLIKQNFVLPGSKVYFEYGQSNNIFKLDHFTKLRILKTGKAGQVCYYLAEYL